MLEPLELAQAQQQVWEPDWCKGSARELDLAALLKWLRDQARAHPLNDITSADVEVGLSSIKLGTGLGGDGVAPLMLRSLPREGKRDLAPLLNACEWQGGWPRQLLLVVMAVLPKEAGGSRTIGLLTMLVRLWCRCRKPHGRKWTEAVAGYFDDAVPGSSAGAAAYERAVLDETAAALQVNVIEALWDLSKFYDSVDMGRLVVTALSWGYPPQILVMLITTYAAPRAMRIVVCLSAGVSPSASVITGCGEGCNMARAMVRGMLQVLNEANPAVQLRQYIDDMPQKGWKGPQVRSC